MEKNQTITWLVTVSLLRLFFLAGGTVLMLLVIARVVAAGVAIGD